MTGVETSDTRTERLRDDAVGPGIGSFQASQDASVVDADGHCRTCSKHSSIKSKFVLSKNQAEIRRNCKDEVITRYPKLVKNSQIQGRYEGMRIGEMDRTIRENDSAPFSVAIAVYSTEPEKHHSLLLLQMKAVTFCDK